MKATVQFGNGPTKQSVDITLNNDKDSTTSPLDEPLPQIVELTAEQEELIIKEAISQAKSAQLNSSERKTLSSQARKTQAEIKRKTEATKPAETVLPAPSVSTAAPVLPTAKEDEVSFFIYFYLYFINSKF